jgi:hypothetical protein
MAAERSPGADPDSTFAAVLAVEQAGLSLRVARATRTTSGAPVAAAAEITAELRCETAAACEGVKRLLERRRLALSQDIGARMLGLGPLVDSFSVAVRGGSLSAKAEAEATDLAGLVERVMGLLSPAPPK